MFRNFGEYKLFNINMKLIEVDGNYDITDVNRMYDIFLEKCSNLIVHISPPQAAKNSKNCLPWYDREVQKSAEQRNNIYEMFIP